MKKNVLYLSWMGTPGGAEIAMLRLIGALDREKYAPHAWLLNPGELEASLAALKVPVTVREAGRMRGLPVNIPFHTALCSYIKKNSIQWIHASGTAAYLAGYMAARLAGIPVFWWLVDMPEGKAAAEKIAGHLPADKIICNSRATLAALVKHYPAQASRAEVVHPSLGPRVSAQPGGSEKLKKEWNLPADARIVTCAGRLQKWKGQDVLVRSIPEILKTIPQAYFIFAGSVLPGMEDGFREELPRLAESLGVSAHCRFTGFYSDLDALMRASGLVVHTSVKPEPFGMVIPEAMRQGCAVIASAAGGPLEIITHGENGWLVTPGDSKELADAVVHLLQDSGLRRRLGEAAVKSVEIFSAEAIARKMEKIYEEF